MRKVILPDEQGPHQLHSLRELEQLLDALFQ